MFALAQLDEVQEEVWFKYLGAVEDAQNNQELQQDNNMLRQGLQIMYCLKHNPNVSDGLKNTAARVLFSQNLKDYVHLDVIHIGQFRNNDRMERFLTEEKLEFVPEQFVLNHVYRVDFWLPQKYIQDKEIAENYSKGIAIEVNGPMHMQKFYDEPGKEVLNTRCQLKERLLRAEGYLVVSLDTVPFNTNDIAESHRMIKEEMQKQGVSFTS